MKGKATPRPWKIEHFSNNRKEWLEIWPDPQDRLGAGTLISTIKLQIGGLDRDRDEANAALIASAPEQQAKIDRLEAEKAVLTKAKIESNKKILCLLAEKAELKTERDKLRERNAELKETTRKLLNQFEKWEGYHQWDEEDEKALEETRTALASSEPEK